jgi:hypothetical protein
VYVFAPAGTKFERMGEMCSLRLDPESSMWRVRVGPPHAFFGIE